MDFLRMRLMKLQMFLAEKAKLTAGEELQVSSFHCNLAYREEMMVFQMNFEWHEIVYFQSE